MALLLTLSLSCTKKKTSQLQTDTAELVHPLKTDTLKFTSGIRSIFQDSKGRFWFGSLQEGAAVFDGKSFTYFTIKEGLSDNQIHSIQEDQNGIIWFDTQDGISSYNGKKITNHTASQNTPAYETFPKPSVASQQAVWTKTDSDLWFGAGTKEGVYRYDGQNLQYLAFPPHQVLNLYDNLFAVTDISKGKNTIWFATYAGVFGYDGRDFAIINDKSMGFDRTIEQLHIRSILEDSKGRLWLGNNGIGVLLKDGDSIVNFSEKNNLIHPNSKKKGDKSPPGTLEHVFTIAEDGDGNIWLGDRDAGIWKYDGDSLKNFTVKDGLTNDHALAIYKDQDGVLWFGMNDGSVFTYNGKTFEKQF
ncbi:MULTISPECIES: two-component regulator propeller domain-containing protein [unclassified Leeuwenhoekiella]|uniref:ligand-binding sensor domain-containing protein n=1 Tax=unclassified Leeuwenhoekiella TaxID=2615029 RepID=UPI0025BAFF8C|nr:MULTISPECIES: two-component regulator propeller domain-containing protein [unclassified Leeuwenhoekiella]